MVLIVLYLYYNLYLFTLNRETDFQDVSSRSQQLDADRNAEKITISNVAESQSGNSIIISCMLTNNGSVATQIVRLWLTDFSVSPSDVSNVGLQTFKIVLQPGQQIPETFTVPLLQGESAADSFALELVTSRSNIATAVIN